MVGFDKVQWPPVSGKNSLPQCAVESEVAFLSSLSFILDNIIFLFRGAPAERERERERERESFEATSRSKQDLPVEKGACPCVTIVLQKLIVEFNFELFTVWSYLSILRGIVFATPVEYQLCHIYSVR